jgi:hypothetical protein
MTRIAHTKYRLIGQPEAGTFTIGEFLDDNPDLDASEIDAIRSLKKGREVTLGGGASGEYTIRRVS